MSMTTASAKAFPSAEFTTNMTSMKATEGRSGVVPSMTCVTCLQLNIFESIVRWSQREVEPVQNVGKDEPHFLAWKWYSKKSYWQEGSRWTLALSFCCTNKSLPPILPSDCHPFCCHVTICAKFFPRQLRGLWAKGEKRWLWGVFAAIGQPTRASSFYTFDIFQSWTKGGFRGTRGHPGTSKLGGNSSRQIAKDAVPLCKAKGLKSPVAKSPAKGWSAQNQHPKAPDCDADTSGAEHWFYVRTHLTKRRILAWRSARVLSRRQYEQKHFSKNAASC